MSTDAPHGLLGSVAAFLAEQQFLLLFVTVAVGYVIGGLKYKGFGLGSTAATIVLGLVVSSVAYASGVEIEYPDLLSNVFFYLFIFAVGLRNGPQPASLRG
jgi:putative transport protein